MTTYSPADDDHVGIQLPGWAVPEAFCLVRGGENGATLQRGSSPQYRGVTDKPSSVHICIIFLIFG